MVWHWPKKISSLFELLLSLNGFSGGLNGFSGGVNGFSGGVNRFPGGLNRFLVFFKGFKWV